MPDKITYRIVEIGIGEMLGEDVPLKKLCDWALNHNAAVALVKLLNDTICNWRNTEFSLAVCFCGPEDRSKWFHHDKVSEELEPGDAVFNYSITNKNRGYRKDQLSIYQWVTSQCDWRLRKDYTQYYARVFPLGAFTKPMPLEWGFAKNPLPEITFE